jgi:hypothetical protein
MASERLLLDPLLQWLTPMEIHRLRGVDKLCKKTIDAYEATKRSYKVQDDFGVGWPKQERLYNLYPKIQTLKFDTEYGIKPYLRPTLESIHLVVRLRVDYDVETGLLTLSPLFVEQVLDTFEYLLEFYDTVPNRQFKNFTLSLKEEVGFHFTIPDGLHVGYDKDGPLYEDMDCYPRTDEFSPALLLSMVSNTYAECSDDEREPYDLVMSRLWDVTEYACVKFSSIVLPACFPGASETNCANLTGMPLSDYTKEDEEALKEFVGSFSKN